ncbi:MAG: hypothetical protein SGBAC_006530 [Bacillariaceae sp.]
MVFPFCYVGNEVENEADGDLETTIPYDVEKLLIHASVNSIPHRLCFLHSKLQQVIFRDYSELTTQHLSFGCKSLTRIQIPDSARIVGNVSFAGRLLEFDLPAGLRTIGSEAFSGCSALQKVKIPDTVVTMGPFVFAGCSLLIEVILSKSLKEIQEGSFRECSSLARIGIPSSVVVIGPCTFYSCVALEEVDLQDGLVSIEFRAFASCRSLPKIHIPPSVRKVKGQAFSSCTSLMEMNTLEGLEEMGPLAFRDCRSLQRIHISSPVRVIWPQMFASCTQLMEAVLPEGLKRITTYSFFQCTLLRGIRFPSTVKDLGACAFMYCSSLREISLPDGLITIRDKVFSQCLALIRVNVPPGIKAIRFATFSECASLTQVDLCEGLESIESSAFSRCSSLVRIAVPSTVKAIGEFAFLQCKSLVSVVIPKKMVATIGCGAFKDASCLVNIEFPPAMNGENGGAISDNCLEGCDILEAVYGSNPVQNLFGRFARHPVHRLCYHSASTPELRREIIGGKNELVDSFGMTPYHVMLSSVDPTSDFLRVLSDRYGGYALGWKDKLGNRALDYLVGNGYWTASSRSLIQCALQKWTIDRLLRWNQESAMVQMSNDMNQILAEDDMERRDRWLLDLLVAMEGHERVEAVSLLELWLWKMGISSTLASAGADGGHLPTNREYCRAKCGASFVVPNVIAFLGYGTTT